MLEKIHITNLTKIFGSHPDKALGMLKRGMTKKEIFKRTGMTVGVNRASFTVQSNEVFVIMGLSGSGKSTLIRLINRLIEPTDGSVMIDGENVTRMSPGRLRQLRRTTISMVFQGFGLFPSRTVLENVEYGLEIQGVSKERRRKKALKTLDLVGLEQYADQMPGDLSGGMKQRVGLARALANDPEILLMDEAFSALDPLIRKDMQDEMLDLQSTMKKTIVFITHDLDEALRIGDRIALMRDGVIEQIGTPEEILTHPANQYVEKFVENVNVNRILTAGSIMKRAEKMILGKDGPRVALKMMKDKGTSGLMVVDRHNRFLGFITADIAKELITMHREGQSMAEEIQNRLIKPPIQVEMDTPVSDILPKMAEKEFQYPAAVIDSEGRLKGVIVRGAIFAVLAGKNGGEDHDDNT